MEIDFLVIEEIRIYWLVYLAKSRVGQGRACAVIHDIWPKVEWDKAVHVQ